MPLPHPFLPHPVYSIEDGPRPSVPGVFIAPQRYVQCPGALTHLDRYLGLLPGNQALLLASTGAQARHGDTLVAHLETSDLKVARASFNGECSIEEIDRIVSSAESADSRADYLIALGGGKCIDTGKCVAHRLGIPVVIVPTLASNDAPCSALSVIYTPEGQTEGVEFFPESPALVVVDTQVVADAPVRTFVAGIGDAMATWYEARTCASNPVGRSALGARPTLASSALGEACSQVLFEQAEAAIEAVERSEVTDEVERIVEANTLLSGVGFESGGLAAAHCVAQGFPAIPHVHAEFLHGEMVAMGLLTQLVLENSIQEARDVAQFFARAGLPIHLGQLDLTADNRSRLELVADIALSLPMIANEPFPVTRDSLVDAMIRADALGREIANSNGDAAWRKLHSS